MPRESSSNAFDDSQNKAPEEELIHNEEVDDFFTRMKYDLRRPKPGDEDVAAARQAIRVAGRGMESEGEIEEVWACVACGNGNPSSHKFCGSCGIPIQTAEAPSLETTSIESSVPIGPSAVATPAGQHHYHHHYHHYFSPEASRPIHSATPTASGDTLRPRAVVGGAPSNRADAAVRKLAQDWSVACNTRHLDDLVELYATDALVLRPNVPPIRGTAAIREFLFSALEAGLGEVELEALRVDVFGDVAYEAGRSKMVVPVAMSKRREERGKYLIISTRTAGEWRIVCDSWSSDLNLQVGPQPGAGKSVISLPVRRP
ncbi:MAG: DUF4440 domain-containing protein [Acidobacteriota bacterium]|nr:DUF4440 domain-containing protein [Acidobacteriota bacterium]